MTITLPREVVERALAVLDFDCTTLMLGSGARIRKSSSELRAALAAPAEPEPVALNYRKMWQQAITDNQRLCAALGAAPSIPAGMVLVPLTDDQIHDICPSTYPLLTTWRDVTKLVRSVEAAHGIAAAKEPK